MNPTPITFVERADSYREAPVAKPVFDMQLEQLLDELNSSLRPRIERPVRQRPLLAVGVALGLGMVLGSLLSGGRRS